MAFSIVGKETVVSEIVDEPEAYFSRFVRTDDPLLQELEMEAKAEHIPIVGPVVGSFCTSSLEPSAPDPSWSSGPPPAIPPSSWAAPVRATRAC